MPKKDIKLIALDMDGTLLNTKKKVDPKTIKTIRQAVEKGIFVAYCSGRGLPELEEYLDDLKDLRYGVCMSGAMVFDFSFNQMIYENSVKQAQIPAIIDVAERFNAMCHVLLVRESIVESSRIDSMETYHMGIYKEMFHRVARPVENLREEVAKYPSIPKINIYFRSPHDRDKGFEELKELPLSFAYAEETSVEMNAPGVSKSTGLKALCDKIGISMDEVMAIGDADNDRKVLESVGLSIAMANAEEQIKAICDDITDDNDHDGVGKAILKYCL